VHLRLGARKVLEPLEGLSATDVPRGEHVLELVGQEQFFELVGNVNCTLWDVQVADDEDELRAVSGITANLPLRV
jgi:hypothetical protein